LRLITAPDGVAEGLANERALPRGGLDALVAGDDRLSPLQRVDIYANMYFYRLLDVLREDFPATAAVLGDVSFHNLITGYLLEYPPTEPSVAWCGQHLSDYLRGHPMSREMPWLAALAALERATLDAFHAAQVLALDAATMNAIPPEQWASVRMRTTPASKILEFKWDVATVLRAIESGRKWRKPAKGDFAILVWRHNYEVAYRKLEQIEHRALKVASRGARFERLCGIIADAVGDTRAPRKIATMLQRWLADGLLWRDPGRPLRSPDRPAR
jgi:hypothetical protein